MRAFSPAVFAALLLLLCCSACARPRRSVGEAILSEGRISLSAGTTDPAARPLFDRVDLVLLPDRPDSLLADFAGSTEYFDAIRAAGGFYVGGDYIEDGERSSGSAVYELDAPAGELPAGQQGWLLLLSLEDTAVRVLDFRPVAALQ